MQITPIEHGLVLAAPTEGYIRTPGLHISDLYGELYRGIDPQRFGGEGGPDTLKMEIGTAFEEALEPAIRKRIIHAERPGEYVTQHAVDCVHRAVVVAVGDAPCPCGAGVIYSPDHFLFNGVFRLGEFKLTWMSIGKGIHDKRFDKWKTQMKVYCYHLGTPYARLYALFVNGDWSFKFRSGPQLLAWDIEFSQKEMREEWNTLLRLAQKKGML